MTTFDVKHMDDALIARPSHDIDTANAAELEKELAASVQPERLIVDLSEVRYIDSAGIDMLIRLSERLHQRRSGLVLVIPQASPLVRLAEIVDLPAALRVYPSVADAVAGSASEG